MHEDDSLTDEAIERLVKPNFYQTCRNLRRSNHELRNRLASIYRDFQFVNDAVRNLSSSCNNNNNFVSVFVNLRCGAWYYDLTTAQTCCFKSTDGHFGNLLTNGFSTKRLNLHLAMQAAKTGVVAIVDSSMSKTKRFPDAFSKTIPIWCAVINRAVAIARGRSTTNGTFVVADEFPHWVSPHWSRGWET